MEPLATLHHFVHPEWFERMGAFEKEENIGLFLAWVRLAFKCAPLLSHSACVGAKRAACMAEPATDSHHVNDVAAPHAHIHLCPFNHKTSSRWAHDSLNGMYFHQE